MKKNIKNKQSGITLIALVVTIIVLLILAGVTLNIAMDNGGIIGRAREAAKTYSKAEQNDLKALEQIDQTIAENDLITFYINNETYYALRNITWEEWITTENNTFNYTMKVLNGKISTSPAGGYVTGMNFEYVASSDQIVENAEYQVAIYR